MVEEDYITIKEVADMWGVSIRRVQILCTTGRIPGAKKKGRSWMIPKNTKRPDDKRIKKADLSSLTAEEVRAGDLAFLFHVSHEIRTNLNTIMGFSDLLKRDKEKPELVERYADNILVSGQYLLDMTNSLLTVIQLEKGTIDLKEEVCELSACTRKLFMDFAEEAEKNNVKLTFNAEITHEMAYIDKERYMQLFGCLLKNSVLTSTNGGTVQVKLSELPGERWERAWFRYEIEDNGSIAGQKNSIRLFDRWQADESIATDVQWNGLNLLLIKRLVDLMDGSIEISSKNGGGNHIVVELPLRVSEQPASEEKSNVVVNYDMLKGLKVLVVEDDDLNRELEEEMLKEVGLEVETAEDGIVCLMMVKNAPDDYYDVILMDLLMPNLDGFKATEVIRGLDNAKKSKIPVIAMSANVSDEDKAAAIKSGMNGFIDKPVSRKKICAIIGDVLLQRGNLPKTGKK